MTPLVFMQSTSQGFDGFEGTSLALLVAGINALAIWLVVTAVVWFSTRPRTPRPGPAVADLGPEPPAIANMLVNGWDVTKVAMPATLVDLAGRRVLGIEDYAGGRTVVRIRSNQPEGETFTAYEQQVLSLVRSRATGGSCPVEALDLGDSGESKSWWQRFEKSVKKDAQGRGLARGRWRHRDRLVIGGLLVLPLLLFGLAMGSARVGESAGDSSSDRWNWLYVMAFLWFVANAYFLKPTDLRETEAGRAAAGRWLGVREYLKNSTAFGDLPPGSVAVWERYLAYAVGFGLAHGTARALPFATDDPNTAWTRYGGQWRQVRIRYPTRFMFGQRPATVFLYGLGLTAFWGFIGFFILPIAFELGWDVGKDIVNGDFGGTSGIENQRTIVAFVAGFLAFFFLACAYVLFRLIGGLGRLVLGFLDLGKSVTVTGEVVNIHMGRFALANEETEVTKALFPKPGGPQLSRGQYARVTMSPRLCHVMEVVRISRDGEPEVQEPLETIRVAPGLATPLPALDAGVVSEIVGLPMTAIDAAEGGMPGAQVFRTGDGGDIKVWMTPNLGGATSMIFGLLAKLPRGDSVDVAGQQGSWIGERVLMMSLPNATVSMDVELPGIDAVRRREIATKLAEHVAERAGTVVPGPDGTVVA